ncbi:MAG: hypothetical protein KC933_39375, partial [Myxococcales bacterium]|nr:hypothetical protein [Myxococcales bacterium]
AFDYEACKHEYWNPEEFSLLWGTPVWDQASAAQRVVLNQLYWVAYYSQIISAEIATIYFNQTSAAGLFAQDDFRQVCDMLDLETSQERAHISAFRTVSDQVEDALFGERVFSYPMRGPFDETMIFQDTDWFRRRWKKLQLMAFGLLSAGNTFLACQYFTVRGLRTLNGKMVQQRLSAFYRKLPDPAAAPLPAAISHFHFMDESFHFNSSTIVGHEVVRCLPPPTRFEAFVANLGLRGCQVDHSHFSVAVHGIFWYDPALLGKIHRVLTSPAFGMGPQEATAMLRACFCEESEGLHAARARHLEARESYRAYLEKVDYAWAVNRDMALMTRAGVPEYLAANRRALDRLAGSA